MIENHKIRQLAEHLGYLEPKKENKPKKHKEVNYEMSHREKTTKPEPIKVPTRIQEIDDLPPSILVDGDLCNLHIYYNKENEEDKWPWHVEYIDTTGKVRLKDKSTTSDYAISNMMNTIRHHGWGKDKVTSLDNKLYQYLWLSNKDEHTIVKKVHKLKLYPYSEDGLFPKINCCPYCDSENIKEEYFKSSPESWRALAGREGYNYECKDCGYRWQNIICMS